MGDSKLAKWYITAELTALRQLLKLTPAGLAKELGVTPQTIVNWEMGKHVPLRSVAKDIGQMAKVEQSRIDFLCFVIDNYKSPDIVASLQSRNIRILEHGERTAGYIFKFELEFIPGPLQEPEYTEMLPAIGSKTTQRRSNRSQVLDARTDATIEVLIARNALRHLSGIRNWEAQVKRLLMQSEKPNWEIRVIDGLHRGSKGAFEIYKPAGAPKAGPAFVYTEPPDQSRYSENDATLAWYNELRKEIWELGRPIEEVYKDGIQLLA